MSGRSIVVPVRLAIGTRVLQTTSRALDADGLFVRCVAPPLQGAQVDVRLYLPDGPPEDIACVVVPERELREVGCRVKFVEMTPKQQARLMRLLAPPTLQPQRAAPKQPLARLNLRTLGRVALQIKVRFESIDALAEQLALDISAGGMFVRCDQPPAVGEEMTLVFALPGEEAPPLSCRGLVVRRVAIEEARFTGRPAGVGVQFVEANDEFRARLDAWLLSAQGLTPLD